MLQHGRAALPECEVALPDHWCHDFFEAEWQSCWINAVECRSPVRLIACRRCSVSLSASLCLRLSPVQRVELVQK